MILKYLAEFREAIGEDSLRCLYCESICDCENNTTVDQNTFNTATVEINKCKKCKERFIFYYLSIDQLIGCTFTCNNICVSIDEERCSLQLINTNQSVDIPLTEFDFSNKEAIFKKLKTYLLFS